jgi:hypothetical protein
MMAEAISVSRKESPTFEKTEFALKKKRRGKEKTRRLPHSQKGGRGEHW